MKERTCKCGFRGMSRYDTCRKCYAQRPRDATSSSFRVLETRPTTPPENPIVTYEIFDQATGATQTRKSIAGPHIEAVLSGVATRCLVDTGASSAFCNQTFFDEMKARGNPTRKIGGFTARLADQQVVKAEQQILIEFVLGENKRQIWTVCMPPVAEAVIIGYDTLQALHVVLDVGQGRWWTTTPSSTPVNGRRSTSRMLSKRPTLGKFGPFAKSAKADEPSFACQP